MTEWKYRKHFLVMFIALLSLDPTLQAGKLTEEEAEVKRAAIRK